MSIVDGNDNIRHIACGKAVRHDGRLEPAACSCSDEFLQPRQPSRLDQRFDDIERRTIQSQNDKAQFV